MALVIRAIYEKGHLRLLDPVELGEGEPVTITIERKTEDDAMEAELKDLLADPQTEEEVLRMVLGDLVQWPDPDDDTDAWVEDMAEEIDLAFRGDPLLSEIIIEDRGEL